MADWIVLSFKIAGYVGILAVLLVLMGRWLLARITKLLDSYSTAYLNQKASIDARIDHLEKLIEEQARLTRTVESIKAEFAALAKAQDNRWAFRKELYVNLIQTISELMQIDAILVLKLMANSVAHDPTQLPLPKHWEIESLIQRREKCGNDFYKLTALSPLAMAEEVVPLVMKTYHSNFPSPHPSTETFLATLRLSLTSLSELLTELQRAGRKDLWGTPGDEARAEGASH